MPVLNLKPTFTESSPQGLDHFTMDSLAGSPYKLMTYSNTCEDVNRSSCHRGKKHSRESRKGRGGEKKKNESRGAHR